ncbi:uncharacterized protein FOMMEDRAFT_29733 [Fomitiporia mediterranea MF3/22]|uniref:uncharacterized protein n=1 Tax=Fomitiporia mediterranea (strain MF3/22) TaxID=694068 RepID=UPI00044081B4|nr:uncharacterized protein FOMMEDRAFT_29733 [Fomitiporia mediterranea MF3/22]EJD00937.1 hypothetical protein FOMMEDRAFT_29733 [Fomitiporia mediterranea MF3/22]
MSAVVEQLCGILFFYNIITKDEEVRFFWSNPRNANGVAFFILCYVGLIGGLAFVINITDWTNLLSRWLVIVLMEYRILSICLKSLIGIGMAGSLCILILYEVESGVKLIKPGLLMCESQRNFPQLVIQLYLAFCCVMLISSSLVSKPDVAKVFNAIGNPMIACIIGCRILLNLKEAGKRDTNGGTLDRVGPASNIQFAQRRTSSPLHA